MLHCCCCRHLDTAIICLRQCPIQFRGPRAQRGTIETASWLDNDPTARTVATSATQRSLLRLQTSSKTTTMRTPQWQTPCRHAPQSGGDHLRYMRRGMEILEPQKRAPQRTNPSIALIWMEVKVEVSWRRECLDAAVTHERNVITEGAVGTDDRRLWKSFVGRE
jgi:hypothetical protein